MCQNTGFSVHRQCQNIPAFPASHSNRSCLCWTVSQSFFIPLMQSFIIWSMCRTVEVVDVINSADIYAQRSLSRKKTSCSRSRSLLYCSLFSCENLCAASLPLLAIASIQRSTPISTAYQLPRLRAAQQIGSTQTAPLLRSASRLKNSSASFL